MTMKQTQTKLFDFSDIGLDFCAGSKNLFPDRFKKMLSLGYNEQTVSSVAVTGNQVVLTYGVSHGYVADRVLKITSGTLAAINNGEFWIDSVTTNTVTMTIDGAPISVAGGFVTKIASLGWQLVYEQPYIHIYKFKQLDESDVYARICFQSIAAQRNAVAVGIGKTVNTATGEITDENCFTDLATCITPADAVSNLRWELSTIASSAANSYTYSQGFATYGKSILVGSLYHLVLQLNTQSSNFFGSVCGILPIQSISNIQSLQAPVLLVQESPIVLTSAQSVQPSTIMRAYVGRLRCVAQQGNTTDKTVFSTNVVISDYMQSEGFNTTTANPLFLYENATGQLIGVLHGLYQLMLTTSIALDRTVSNNPRLVRDVDLNNIGVQHRINASNSNNTTSWLLVMVEELKI